MEIPNFCVVGPQIEDWAFQRDPLNKGPTDNQTYTVKNPAYNRFVKLFLHKDFAAGLKMTQYGDKAVSEYETVDQVSSVLRTGVAQVNYSSIAKVCLTDAQTVETMLQQIVAHLKSSQDTRLNLKVGTFVVKNSTVSFVQSLAARS